MHPVHRAVHETVHELVEGRVSGRGGGEDRSRQTRVPQPQTDDVRAQDSFTIFGAPGFGAGLPTVTVFTGDIPPVTVVPG